MKSAGKARSNGLYRHIRTSKEIIRNLLNDYINSSKVYFCYVLCLINPGQDFLCPFNRISQRIPSSCADTVPDPHRHCTDAVLPV